MRNNALLTAGLSYGIAAIIGSIIVDTTSFKFIFYIGDLISFTGGLILLKVKETKFIKKVM